MRTSGGRSTSRHARPGGVAGGGFCGGGLLGGGAGVVLPPVGGLLPGAVGVGPPAGGAAGGDKAVGISPVVTGAVGVPSEAGAIPAVAPGVLGDGLADACVGVDDGLPLLAGRGDGWPVAEGAAVDGPGLASLSGAHGVRVSVVTTAAVATVPTAAVVSTR